MRKLVTPQIVEEIRPIPGADFIEKARCKGWWVVVKKDQFKVGELCLFYEIDSLLPNVPQYEFLLKGQTLKKSILDGKEIEGLRLKTATRQGQISQGLIMPLSDFPIAVNAGLNDDVSALLNVVKYQRPIPPELAGEMKGSFPGIIPRSDEDRIQSCPEMLNTYKGQRFYATSKVDGESSTAYKHEGEYGICGHEIEFIDNDKTRICRVARQYNLKEKMPNGFAIQMEIAGEGIHKNRIKLKGVDLFVYYVFDIEKHEYLKLDDMLHFVKELGMKTVPVVYDNLTLNHTCEEILTLADASSPLNPQEIQEGLVFRLYDSLEKISFKAISNKYLIKHGL